MNRDGAPDFVVTNTYDDDISIFRNDGFGGFASRTDHPAGYGPLGIAVGDLNADGMLDIVVGNGNSNTLSTFLGNGDGTLRLRRNFSTNYYPGLITIADMNGDGIPDLAIGAPGRRGGGRDGGSVRGVRGDELRARRE